MTGIQNEKGKQITENEAIIPIGNQSAIGLNMGTGDVLNSTIEFAEKNIQQFIKDLEIEGITYENLECEDRGRFTFLLNFENVKEEIEMPGISLENVRYIDSEKQNIWDFPRLYVEGSSWIWKYALDIVKSDFINCLNCCENKRVKEFHPCCSKKCKDEYDELNNE